MNFRPQRDGGMDPVPCLPPLPAHSQAAPLILLDIDPDINLHIAVPVDFARSSLGSMAPPPAADVCGLVCLGCFATTSTCATQQRSQSLLTHDLLAYHKVDPTLDAALSVQLTMTHMLPSARVDEFQALVLDATSEIQDIFDGNVRCFLQEMSPSALVCCTVVAHFKAVHALVSWLCCSRNAELKLGCPTYSVQKASFNLVFTSPQPTNERTDDHDIVAALNEMDDFFAENLLQDCVEYSLYSDSDETVASSCDDQYQFHLMPSSPSPPPPAMAVVSPVAKSTPLAFLAPSAQSPTSIDSFDAWHVAKPGSCTLDHAEFVDVRGHSLEFKPFYYRNNKKGGIRNLRCFPQCKRGHHSTTSFCGDSLHVRVHLRDDPPHPPIVAFARFRNSVEVFDAIGAGMVVPQAAIFHNLRSKDNPKAMWMQTKCLEPRLFEIRPSGRAISWHYGFHGASLHKTSVHCIEVAFFILEPTHSTSSFQCIGTIQSPHFRIVSSRTKEP
ncbi:Aste57867_11036 [Aphanomyces stellatus]|uniref:Aste57867_11036 protein n=1 Tax=Aphanomyces stellatus TaxID=120398 RepID=A0A485KTQ9_9STRA|nr:hypothetical protein As57867_010994 [Aphanomyces stellatus]VFT87904.1 Aste57867_11036 [Aphanomyces stellatus]